MAELNIKDYIRKELPSEAKNIALEFIDFLEKNGIIFYKDRIFSLIRERIGRI